MRVKLMTISTPADLTIHPRDLSFGRNNQLARHWLGGDPVATTFFNALSASFPQGERFFIDAVKAYRNRVDPQLQDQITSFVAQESVHTREHLLFNSQIGAQGYDLTAINAFLTAQFTWARKETPVRQLAATTALEHFTAILAHAALTDSTYLAAAAPSIQRMWRWHAIEEIEHKSVAFDTFVVATKNLDGFRRWSLRSYVMVVATILFLRELFFSASQFFRQDKINTPRTWLRFIHYILIRPGMLRKVFPSYLTYFKPSFHPWQVDDRALIAAVDLELAGTNSTL